MTDIEKIAAILETTLSDALKLDLIRLLTQGPQVTTTPVPYPVPTYTPSYPSWPYGPVWAYCNTY